LPGGKEVGRSESSLFPAGKKGGFIEEVPGETKWPEVSVRKGKKMGKAVEGIFF